MKVYVHSKMLVCKNVRAMHYQSTLCGGEEGVSKRAIFVC